VPREHGEVAWNYVATPSQRFRSRAVVAALWIVAVIRFLLIVVSLGLIIAIALLWTIEGISSGPEYEFASGAEWNAALQRVVIASTVVAGVVVAVPLAFGRRRRYERRALGAVEARAIEGSDRQLVDGVLAELSIAAGCAVPRVLMVESPALNAMAIGTNASSMVVVLTSGLVQLPRRQLEAVLAYQLGLISSGDVRMTTSILALTAGRDPSWLRLGLRAWALRQTAAQRDRVAVSFTRDPDALVAAFRAIVNDSDTPPGLVAEDAPLWLEFPPELDLPIAGKHHRALRDAVRLDRRIAALEPAA
jgi:Zn-dependent protease with chaperone function